MLYRLKLAAHVGQVRLKTLLEQATESGGGARESKRNQFKLNPLLTTLNVNDVNACALESVLLGSVTQVCQPPVAGTLITPVTLLPPTSK